MSGNCTAPVVFAMRYGEGTLIYPFITHLLSMKRVQLASCEGAGRLVIYICKRGRVGKCTGVEYQLSFGACGFESYRLRYVISLSDFDSEGLFYLCEEIFTDARKVEIWLNLKPTAAFVKERKSECYQQKKLKDS